MTYTAISAYFVVDAKVSYKIDKQWTVNAGIDNLNNENYWIYHPFMQRTYTAQIKYNY
jgi:iron complex outermembrane receptor protein